MAITCEMGLYFFSYVTFIITKFRSMYSTRQRHSFAYKGDYGSIYTVIIVISKVYGKIIIKNNENGIQSSHRDTRSTISVKI